MDARSAAGNIVPIILAKINLELSVESITRVANIDCRCSDEKS